MQGEEELPSGELPRQDNWEMGRFDRSENPKFPQKNLGNQLESNEMPWILILISILVLAVETWITFRIRH